MIKTPLEIYHENSLQGRSSALMGRMFHAIQCELDPDMRSVDDDIFQPFPQQVVHEAFVGLAILLLTYNARMGDDLATQVDEFLSDVRAAYSCNRPEDLSVSH